MEDKIILDMYAMMKEMQTEMKSMQTEMKSMNHKIGSIDNRLGSLENKVDNGFTTIANIIRDEVKPLPSKRNGSFSVLEN